GVNALLLSREAVPGGIAGIAGRENGVGGNDAKLLFAGEAAGADRVPALVVDAVVFVDVFLRDLKRGVRLREGEIHEERLTGALGLIRLHLGDGVVGEVPGERVSVGVNGDGDAGVVFVEYGAVLVGPSVAVSIEVVEAALQGEVGILAFGAVFKGWGKVPLSDGPCRVAVEFEGLGEGFGIAGHPAALGRLVFGVAPAGIDGEQPLERFGQRLAGVTLFGLFGVRCGEEAHFYGLGIAAGEQGGSSGGADGVGVEADVADAVAGEAIDVGGVDFTAVASEVGVAYVVDDDDEDVGLGFVGGGGLLGRSCSGGAGESLGEDGGEDGESNPVALGCVEHSFSRRDLLRSQNLFSNRTKNTGNRVMDGERRIVATSGNCRMRHVDSAPPLNGRMRCQRKYQSM